MFDENYSENFEKHWNARHVYNTEKTKTTIKNRRKILTSFRPVIKTLFKNIKV